MFLHNLKQTLEAEISLCEREPPEIPLSRTELSDYKNVLNNVLTLLEASEETGDKEYQERALRLLQDITINREGRFTFNKTLGVLMNKEDKPILKGEESSFLKVTLPQRHCQGFLQKLHQDLMYEYQHHVKFPTDDSGEVNNAVTRQWQTDMMKPPDPDQDNPDQAFVDFRGRGFSIPDQVVDSLESFHRATEDFISRANYPAEDHALLTQWFRSKAGQDINRFNDLFAQSKSFSDVYTDVGKVQGSGQWQINPETGKIQCQVDTVILTLGNGLRGALVNTAEMGAIPISYLNSASASEVKLEGPDELAPYLQERRLTQTPLLETHATIELDLMDTPDGRVVKPKFVELDMHTYAETLKTPTGKEPTDKPTPSTPPTTPRAG